MLALKNSTDKSYWTKSRSKEIQIICSAVLNIFPANNSFLTDFKYFIHPRKNLNYGIYKVNTSRDKIGFY